jgi:hypothetical protein
LHKFFFVLHSTLQQSPFLHIFQHILAHFGQVFHISHFLLRICRYIPKERKQKQEKSNDND